MNSMNINVQDGKSQFPRPVAQLTALYAQIAAAGYDCDHPWCLALAGIISEEEDATRLTRLGAHSTGIDPVRQHAYEIESRIGNVAILVEAIFDKLDSMDCTTPELHHVANAINCFANSAMESAQAIRGANEQILALTCGGAQ